MTKVFLCQTDGLIQHTLENEIKNYETQLENIGTVNYLAKEDFETLNSRHEEITGNIEDLNLAKKELNSHIKEIENEISFRIESSFNSISVHFLKYLKLCSLEEKDLCHSQIKKIF